MRGARLMLDPWHWLAVVASASLWLFKIASDTRITEAARERWIDHREWLSEWMYCPWCAGAWCVVLVVAVAWWIGYPPPTLLHVPAAALLVGAFGSRI